MRESIEDSFLLLRTEFEVEIVPLKYFMNYLLVDAKVVHEGELRRVVALFEGKIYSIKPHIRIHRHVRYDLQKELGRTELF